MKDNSKIKNKNPFRVPDNYFNEVRSEIYGMTGGSHGKKAKSRIIRLVKPALILAAAMLALAIISYTGLKLLFPEYGERDEENYTELLYQFEEAELIEKLTEQDPDAGMQSAEDDEIIDYLIDHDIEYTSIIEFLN
ncbi:MAG: hypothetical protein U9N72_01780 [Bacteroidota bacterium]|nr:hypothetical protein [Bacteroidota bacterium]